MDRSQALTLLGVGQDATVEEIKARSLLLLDQYHLSNHPEAKDNKVLTELLSERRAAVLQARDILMQTHATVENTKTAGPQFPSVDQIDTNAATSPEPIGRCLTCGSNLSSYGICDVCRRQGLRSVTQAKPSSSWSEILGHSIWLAGGTGCLIGIALGAGAGVVGGATIGFLFFAVRAASSSRGGTGIGLLVGLVVAGIAFAIVYNEAYDTVGGGRFESINAMHEHELVRRRVAFVAAALVSIVTGILAFAVTKGLAGRRS
ncbi:MAG: hypothetical protein HPKKFMNG_02046 [Planctomycetes bacterium]|nr:hypothetical protein [Planctomycetota bacterium]